ncbi:MAG: type II toxin-antitoxin system Phd/YefM family antitoxin [Chloroflexi bacterium]|nr:type II toxin-antitoxin system Phd/YefM family antitoxin [Chloroflexota bacterium]
MTKKVSTAQAKAQFSALVDDVAYGGEHVIIERRGKPLAALVSIEELTRLEKYQAMSAKPQGALALVGAWRELEDAEIDSLITHIYAERENP